MKVRVNQIKQEEFANVTFLVSKYKNFTTKNLKDGCVYKIVGHNKNCDSVCIEEDGIVYEVDMRPFSEFYVILAGTYNERI